MHTGSAAQVSGRQPIPVPYWPHSWTNCSTIIPHLLACSISIFAAIHHPWDGCLDTSIVANAAVSILAYLASEIIASLSAITAFAYPTHYTGICACFSSGGATHVAIDAIDITCCTLGRRGLQHPANDDDAAPGGGIFVVMQWDDATDRKDGRKK